MAFAKATLAKRQAVRDAAIELDKAVTLAHDTGPLLALGPAVDAAGEALVSALADTGSAIPDTQVIVSNGATGKVTNSTGTQNITGTLQVRDGALKQVVLPAATAMVSNTAEVTIANSANNKTVTGSAVVAKGAVSRVAAPDTAAIVTNDQALTGVTPTGTFTNTVTFAVTGGVITGITLS
ncbi:hypothetical protein RCIP0039_00003 [Klebsiella phage RCIP0039]|uniref:Uncharacterized protein n=1 Tax=Acinetobacter phage vB_AbaA_LLY TaxID=2966626 RepID=A0AAF0D8K9_9CAUD|nr:hypothetical protein [Salmonella enterica]WEV89143.1 hypothetical protein [Acinetobacter phage vB_AbaA_LLY]